MSKKCIYNAAVKRAKELNRDLKDNPPIGVYTEYNFNLPQNKRFKDALDRVKPTMRKLNSEFKAKNFGQIATLNTALSNGVGINITVLPSMELAYEYKNGELSPKEFREEYEKEINKTPDNYVKEKIEPQEDTGVERPAGFYMGNTALEEQERRYDELNSINIVPSVPAEVAELFESNPELANEVYGALGVEQSSENTDFSDTEVKEAVYHSSTAEFNEFKQGKDGAIHFGDKKAATERTSKASKKYLKKVKLKVNNLVESVDSVDFEGTRKDKESKEYIVEKLDLAKTETQEHLIALFANEKITKEQLEQYWNSSLETIYKEVFNSDGYSYINLAENKGSRSYVVFNPNQIEILEDGEIEYNEESGEYEYLDNNNTTVQDLSGNTYSVNESDITTYETESGPIRYITDENGDMVMLSDKNTDVVEDQITPQQKQQAQQIYSQYLEQNPNGSVEEFKNWVDNNDTVLDDSSQQPQQPLDNQVQQPLDNQVQYQLPQGREIEEFVASEKAIRDLAARMSDRIGIPVEYISDRSQQFKGKLENGTAIINLAYATLDTPIHEILGHPIIRAIKKGNTQSFAEWVFNNNPEFSEKYPFIGAERIVNEKLSKSEKDKLLKQFEKETTGNRQLYQNLLKELEYGRGKEVFDRIKRDYKDKPARFAKDVYGNELHLISPAGDYTLEEQQEEALVELLGLYTAGRLDKVEDRKLISLLKRLLKEMEQSFRSLINQKEVDIDKLPDNMTLGDIADLLAYSNSKLLLPGNEVVYTTPDNQKFKTYAEASKHISDLAESVEDVDLSDIKFENKLPERFVLEKFDRTNLGEIYYKEDGQWYLETIIDETYTTKEKITEEEVKRDYAKYSNHQVDLNSFLEKNKQYAQSKEIIEEWKKANNIQYNPEEVYSRGQGFYSVAGAFADFDVELMFQNLLAHIEDNKKAGGQFTISATTDIPDHSKSNSSLVTKNYGKNIYYKIFPKSEDILWATPQDCASGSVVDAAERVGSKLGKEITGVSYTKFPSLGNVKRVQPSLAETLDKTNTKRNFYNYNELGINLTHNNFRLEYDEGIPYSTKKIIDSINSILDQKYGKLNEPEIKRKGTEVYVVRKNSVTKEIKFKSTNKLLAEAYFRLNNKRRKAISGIFENDLNRNSLRIETEFEHSHKPTQTNETLKESISEVQQRTDYRTELLPDKFVSKGEDKGYSSDTWFYEKDGEWYMKYVPFDAPFETEVENHDNQKMSEVGLGIDEVWESYLSTNPEGIEDIELKEKEYTEQALINLRVARLKEVAKKYPRSLIRSEVRPINSSSNLGFTEGELPFQKISQSEIIPLFPAQPSKLITDNSQNQKEITQEQIDTEITVAKDSEVREAGILEEELGTEAAKIVSTNPETREGGEYYSIDVGDENEMNTSVNEDADFSEYLNSRIELLNTIENKIKKLHRNKNRSEKENTLLEYLTDMQEALQEEISDNVDSNKAQVIKSLYNEIDALVSLIDELNSANDPTEVMLKLEANQFFDRLEFVSQLLDDRDSNDKTYFHEQLLKGFSDGESIYNKLFTEVNQATKKFENSIVDYMINLVLAEDTWIDIKKSAITNAVSDKEAEKRIQEIEDKIKEIIEDPENIYIDNDSKLAAGFVVPSNMYNSLMADFIYVTRNSIEKTEKQKLSSARNTINTVFKKIEDIRLPNGETLQEALFEKNKFGGRTQKLIRPLASFWYNKTFPKIRGAIKDFQTSLYLRDGNTEDAYRDMIESIQANGDILILQKIPSVAKKYKDSPELSEFFTYTYSEMAEYEARMIEHYGETAYRKILAESERSLSNFVNDPETVEEFRYNMNPLAFIKHFYSANPKEVNEATGNFNNPKYNYIMPKYGDKRFINDEFAAIENQGIEGFKESYSALEESLEYISNTFPDETGHTTVPNLIHNTTRETLNHWRYTRNWNPNLLRFLNIVTDRFSKYLDGFSGTFIRNEYETKNKKGQELVAKNFSSYGRKSIKSSMEVLQNAPFEVLEKKAKELGLSIPADYSDSAKDRKELAEAIATASVTKTSELNIRVRMNAALEIAESYNTRLETNKVIEFVKTFLRKKGAKNTYDYISGQQEVNVHKNGFRSISSMIKPNFSDRDVALSRLDPSNPDYQLPNKKKVKRLSPAEKEVKKLLEEEKENLYGWNVSFTFQGVEYYVDEKTKKPYKKTYEGENLDEEVNTPMLPEEFENVYKNYFEARMSQLGKGVTTSSILQGLGANVSAVYLRLNFLAGYGNRLQGKYQNNMGAASGLNGYDTHSLFLARKFLNFKNTDKMFRLYANAPGFLFTKKKRQQMEILNMIIDNFHLVEQQFDLDVGKDQFLSAISQKYANFASDLSVNNPEDQNQSELLLAMFINLKIEKIVGQNADGTNRTEMVPFFDPDTFTFPYETDGSLTLKPEFQTQTNIENWQSGGKGGEQSSFFMNRYKNNRDRLHGAYAENQKSNIRNNIFGELAMKFKPWMVANLFNEYGYKTIDYSTGTLDKKGRSLPFLEHPTVGITHLLASNLAGNGTLTGSAILAIAPILGLSGAMSVAIPAVLGVTILGTGYFGYQHLKKRKNILDSQKTNMKAEIRLTASYALETFQRILQTTARHIPLHKYDTTKGLLNTEKAINFALTKNAGISEADRRLMSEKSQLVADKLLLGVTTLIGSRLIAAMLKSLFIDDDDDDEEKEHQEKEITYYLNAFLNVMNGAMTNMNMWEDPIAIFKSASSLPVEKFVYGSVDRVARQAGKALDGKSTWEDVGWKAARSVSEYAGVPSTLRKIADGTLLQNPRTYNRGWYGEEETKRSYRTEDRNLTKELNDNRGRFRVSAERVANKKLLEMFPDLEEYKREELASKVMQRFLQEQGAYNPKDPKKAIEEVDWDSLVEEFKDYELPLTEEGELKSRRKKKKKRRKKKSGSNSLGTSL